MSKLSNFDIPASLETVWAALNEYDDSQKTWPDDSYRFINGEKQRDDICTAMAWITEALGYEISTAPDSTNGEYVKRPEVHKEDN